MITKTEGMQTVSDAEKVNTSFEGMAAPARIARLHEPYGSRLVLSSSFGLQAAVMLDLVKKHAPGMPVVWLDTGYLFPETYRYAEQLIETLGVDVKVYQPKLSPARQEALYGKLWEQGEEGNARYGLINKIEPMNRALQELGADIWISGLRRSHSSTRANRQFAEQQKSTLKVYPILDWADAQVAAYFYDNNLPKHPLEAHGYQTMGDWHPRHQCKTAILPKRHALMERNMNAVSILIPELQISRFSVRIRP